MVNQINAAPPSPEQASNDSSLKQTGFTQQLIAQADVSGACYGPYQHQTAATMRKKLAEIIEHEKPGTLFALIAVPDRQSRTGVTYHVQSGINAFDKNGYISPSSIDRAGKAVTDYARAVGGEVVASGIRTATQKPDILEDKGNWI
jgi:hypothetical protein